MSRTWIYSDPHFCHTNILKFVNFDGSRLRPHWDDVDKMNEEMIEWYNEVVRPEDRVYILGDVAFSSANMHKTVSKLNGRKVLVPGNHEPTKMRKYFDLFDDVRGYVVKKGFVMSHIPIHPGSLSRWKLNIHGHLHANCVKEGAGWSDTYESDMSSLPDDLRYYCACVERTNFRPKMLDEILSERGLK